MAEHRASRTQSGIRRVPLRLASGRPQSALALALALFASPAVVLRVAVARGVVKTVGPGGTYVAIAHEPIDGFLDATTAAFEPRAASQLESVHEGDTVSFSFTVTGDGRRILDQMKTE
jgi:Cu/Ag efflux protein CusF